MLVARSSRLEAHPWTGIGLLRELATDYIPRWQEIALDGATGWMLFVLTLTSGMCDLSSTTLQLRHQCRNHGYIVQERQESAQCPHRQMRGLPHKGCPEKETAFVVTLSRRIPQSTLPPHELQP